MQIRLKRSTIVIVLTLIISLSLLIALLVATPSQNRVSNTVTPIFTTVSTSDFRKEIDSNSDEIILDVRTAEEFASGKIAAAVNIDYNSAIFRSELSKLDKSKEYLVYCNSGNRSANALKVMKELGFTKVYELKGGIQAWRSEGLATCTSC